MYNLSSVCFMCLNNNSSLKNIFEKDIENETVNQVKYVLPELMILEPEFPVHICSTCHTKLHSFYSFKKMCVENYCRLKCYIQSAQTTQEDKNEAESNELTKQDMDTDLIIIKDDNRDPLVLEKNTGIKEECNLSSDNEDADCYQPFQFVKCEVADEAQNSGPSFAVEDDNQINNHQESQDYVQSLYNKNFLKKSDWTKYTSIHIGGKDFRCLICNKEFTAKNTLKTHMKIHEGIKEFECAVCHKKFSRNSHLKEHMKLHEGIKDYECTVCNKKFTQNSHLKIHLKMHQGIKNYECAVCLKRFTLRCTLTRHMKFHAGIKDFECHICHKKFSQNGHLKQHISNIHSVDRQLMVDQIPNS